MLKDVFNQFVLVWNFTASTLGYLLFEVVTELDIKLIENGLNQKYIGITSSRVS